MSSLVQSYTPEQSQTASLIRGPFDNSSKYSVSYGIYTPSEIGGPGERTINRISWTFTNYVSQYTLTTVNIKLAHTSMDTVPATTYSGYSSITSTLCFTGSITINNGVIPIILTTPFVYNGTDNLLVIFENNSGSTLTGLGLGGSLALTAGKIRFAYGNNSTSLASITTMTPSAKPIIMNDFISSGYDGLTPINTIPFYGNYNYGISYFIYTKDEIDKATIYSISFQLLNYKTLTKYKNIKITLAHIEKDIFDYIPQTGLTNVTTTDLTECFYNDIIINNGILTIPFLTNFVYVNNKNLLIVIENLGGVLNNIGVCKSYTINTNRCAYLFSNQQITASTDMILNNKYLPKIQFNRNFTMTGFAPIYINDCPFNYSFNYGIQAFIYRSHEIGGSKNIKSLSFQLSGYNSNYVYDRISIKLAHVSSMTVNTFTTNPTIDFSNITLNDLKTCVLKNSIIINNNVMTIDLKDGFSYQNQYNLLLIIENYDGTKTSSSGRFQYTIDKNMSAYYFNEADPSTIDPVPSMIIGDNRPVIKFNTNNCRNIISSNTWHNIVPFNPTLKYEVSYALYKSYEIGDARTITSISWHFTGYMAPRTLSPVNIKLAHTTLDVFSSTTYSGYSSITSTTCLSNSSITINNGLITVTLTTPFNYDGNRNLIVIFENNSNSSITNVDAKCNVYSTIDNRCAYYSNSSTSSTSLLGATPMNLTKTIPFCNFNSSTSNIYSLSEQISTKSTIFQAPLRSLVAYAVAYSIYLPSEIGGVRTITSISWNFTGYSAPTTLTSVNIKLAHTTLDVFSSTTYSGYSSITSTLCFSGSITINNGLITVTLATPFVYNGNSNLMIITENNSGSVVSGGSSYASALTPATVYRTSHGGGSSLLVGASTMTLTSTTPNVIFNFNDTIIDTNAQTYNTIPYNGSWRYTVSYSIYTPTEIGVSIINSLSWNFTGYINTTPITLTNVNIKLLHTTMNAFSSTTYSDYTSIPSTTHLSGAAITFYNGLITVNLTTPFNYDMTRNLIVIFENNSGLNLFSSGYGNSLCTSSSTRSNITARAGSDSLLTDTNTMTLEIVKPILIIN